MRHAIVLATLAALGLVGAGCANGSGAPSAPAAPQKPSSPTAPSNPAAPLQPAALSGPAAPKPASLVDRAPIKADVSKIKFTVENADLFGWDDGESRAFFYTNGLGEVVVRIPADGSYDIVITASCQAAKGENAKFKLKVDGAPVGSETQLKAEDAKDYSFTTALKAGDRKIGVEFTNDMYKEGEYDLNFFLHGVTAIAK